jgi:hypothetical protein
LVFHLLRYLLVVKSLYMNIHTLDGVFAEDLGAKGKAFM